MDELEDRLVMLLEECRDVTPSHTFPIAQEAVRIAEMLGDTGYRVITHYILLCACTVQGRMKEAVVALVWLLEHSDHPCMDDWRDEFYVMAAHLLGSISAMPDIPRRQVLSIQEDILQRLSDYGVGDRTLMRMRYITQLRLGDLDAAENLWRRTQGIEPGGRWIHTDVAPHYVALWQVLRAWFRREPDAALAMASKMPRSPGDLEEREVACCAWIQMSLLSYHGGNMRLAEDACRLAAKFIKGLPLYTGVFGEITACMALVGQLKRALKFTESHATWWLNRGDGEDHFCLHAGNGVVLGMAGRARATVKMRFPREFERVDPSGCYDAHELSEWCFARARDVADAFDRRNGNDTWTRMLEWRIDLLEG